MISTNSVSLVVRVRIFASVIILAGLWMSKEANTVLLSNLASIFSILVRPYPHKMKGLGSYPHKIEGIK